MKFILLIILDIISYNVFSQIDFSRHKLTYGTMPRQIALADIDEDGDLDLISSYVADNVIAIYFNDGYGYFNSNRIINSVDEIVSGSIVVVDIDDDGKLDIISGGENSIIWYKNLGNGNFGPCQYISDSTYMYPDVFVIDIDNDNLKDVLFSSYGDGKVGYYKNLGNGFFSSLSILDNNADGASSISANDLDNDNLPDVLATSFWNNEVKWYKNNGNGNFSAPLIISTNALSSKLVTTSDLDNDNFSDIIYYNHPNLMWKKNLGNGLFSTPVPISSSLIVPSFLSAVDIDNDYDIDLIVPSTGNDTLFWQENLGGGIFGPKQIISTEIDGPYGISAGDISGDGTIDIAVGGRFDNTITVFHSKNNVFEIKQVISNITDGVRYVHSDDLNNDGQIDILAASFEDNKITWFQNLGNQVFSIQKVITDSLMEPTCVISADLNSDGLFDVVSAANNDVLIWQENLGNGQFGSPQILSNLNSTNPIRIIDLNNDGNKDIVVRMLIGGSPQIQWFENLGNGTFNAGILIIGFIGLTGFDFSDINNDGKKDLIIFGGAQIGCCINNGNGNFATIQFIPFFGATSIAVKDINQDGYDDIIAIGKTSISSDYFIKLYENDNTGNYTSELIVDTLEEIGYTLFATDLNNDSLPDVLVGCFHEILWVENLGGGNYSSINCIDSIGPGIRCIYPTDLDNDEDIDIIVTNDQESSVTWYENLQNNFIDTIIKCESDTVLIFGSWQSQAGNYLDSLINVIGGDSIVIVMLENYQTIYPIDTAKICEGDFYNFYGQILTTSGTYHSTYQSIHGCDSIVELPLEIIPLPDVFVSEFCPDSVCIDSGLVSLPIGTPIGGSYSGIGVIGLMFDPLICGIGNFWLFYSYTDTTTGCTNQDSTQIKVYNPNGVNDFQSIQFKLYPNPGTENIILEIDNFVSEIIIQLYDIHGKIVIQKEVANQISIINTLGLSQGSYTYIIKHRNNIIESGKWVKQ